MTCKYCEIPMEDREKTICELHEAILPIINEFIKKMPPAAISAILMHHAKELVCTYKLEYLETIGMLQEMLNSRMQEIYQSHHEEEEEEEEKK